MTRWRRVVRPVGVLDRTRLIAVGIGGAGLLGQLPSLGNPAHSDGFRWFAGAAIVALFGFQVLTLLRGRTSWWTVPVVPPLIVAGASGLIDPLAGTSLAIGSTVVLSLYASTPMWVARVAGAMAAMPVAVRLSPEWAGHHLSWHDGVVLNILPQILLVASLTRVIYLALLRQERAVRREATLARAGRELIGVTDRAAVRAIGGRVAGELAALSPGTAFLVIRRDADGPYVANQAGIADNLRGRRDPDLDTLVPGIREWTVDSLGTQDSASPVHIAVGGRRAVRDDVVDGFRTLSHQVLLAEEGCRVHAELDHLAHHDHLTQLPTRARFFRTLHDALAGGAPGTVALLNVDLDDFKQVNDSYGHAAGDELLIEVAARMAAVAEGRGLAGRFGGDEFALLLTGLPEPGAAHEVARLLSDRLAEPLRLTAATVTAGSSIGVAVSEPGVTAEELIRRADMAMYAAKAAGKNRVELAGVL